MVVLASYLENYKLCVQVILLIIGWATTIIGGCKRKDYISILGFVITIISLMIGEL